MNKTRNSLYNSITSVLFTIVNGLCNLIVTRKMIEVYGSDFNGLNSTATQFVNVLLIIEGGFAIAANVALFKPLSKGDNESIGRIFSATEKRFQRIALVFFLVGSIVAFVFTLSIKTSLSHTVSFCVFIMLVLSTGFGLFHATKYKVLFQSDQKEYIINTISIITYTLSYFFMYIAILVRCNMLILRLIVMMFALINSILVGVICKKQYPYINRKYEPDFESIKGTNDVFVQKIVGVIYQAAPIVVISSVVSTAAASVYAVYNTVFTLLRSAENAIINAPRMSLGRLATEEGTDSENFRSVYNQYEFCMFFSICSMLSVATVLIMPFVSKYAKSFHDISYENWGMAVLLILICYVECIHIPSGNLINMTGKFKQGKNIQIISGIVLLISLFVCGLFRQNNYILLAILITAIVLAMLEIGFVLTKLVKHNYSAFLRNLGVNSIAAITAIAVELQFDYHINGFVKFFLVGALIFFINSLFIFICNYIFNKELCMNMIKRLFAIFHAHSHE